MATINKSLRIMSYLPSILSRGPTKSSSVLMIVLAFRFLLGMNIYEYVGVHVYSTYVYTCMCMYAYNSCILNVISIHSFICLFVYKTVYGKLRKELLWRVQAPTIWDDLIGFPQSAGISSWSYG